MRTAQKRHKLEILCRSCCSGQSSVEIGNIDFESGNVSALTSDRVSSSAFESADALERTLTAPFENDQRGGPGTGGRSTGSGNGRCSLGAACRGSPRSWQRRPTSLLPAKVGQTYSALCSQPVARYTSPPASTTRTSSFGQERSFAKRARSAPSVLEQAPRLTKKNPAAPSPAGRQAFRTRPVVLELARRCNERAIVACSSLKWTASFAAARLRPRGSSTNRRIRAPDSPRFRRARARAARAPSARTRTSSRSGYCRARACP